MEQVIVKLDLDSMTVEFEVKGAPGTKCKDITEILSRGKNVTKQEVTAEYYDGNYNEYVSVK